MMIVLPDHIELCYYATERERERVLSMWLEGNRVSVGYDRELRSGEQRVATVVQLTLRSNQTLGSAPLPCPLSAARVSLDKLGYKCSPRARCVCVRRVLSFPYPGRYQCFSLRRGMPRALICRSGEGVGGGG